MMTIDDLRRVIRDLPGTDEIWITFPDDEVTPMIVTYDKKHGIIRLCARDDGVGLNEHVLEDYSPESGQLGDGA